MDAVVGQRRADPGTDTDIGQIVTAATGELVRDRARAAQGHGHPY